MAKLKPAAAARIQPVPNEFADDFLDVIGTDFRFDHAKGLAEWIKNSADAYVTTTGAKDGEKFIVLRFKQGRPKRDSVFECIDFVGMTKTDIDKALKVWGGRMRLGGERPRDLWGPRQRREVLHAADVRGLPLYDFP